MKAGKYSSVKGFAAAQGKSATWVNEFRKVAVSQGVLTATEWKACFKQGRVMDEFTLLRIAALTEYKPWEEVLDRV